MAQKIDPPVVPEIKSTDALEQDIRELAQLSSKPETLTFGGVDYKVGKLTVRKLGPFMGAIKNVIPLILQSIAQHNEIRLAILIDAGFTDAIAESLSIVTDVDAEIIKDMEATEFMILSAKVLVVNMDFFFHRLPEISGLVGEAVIKAALALDQKVKDGDGSSNALSPMDTVLPT